MTQMGLVKVETKRGDSIEAYGRRFIPVVRITSAIKHQGTIHQDQVEGGGWGVAIITPLSVVEERDGNVRTLPIPDKTGLVLRQMALLAAVIPVLAWTLILINRQMRRR